MSASVAAHAEVLRCAERVSTMARELGAATAGSATHDEDRRGLLRSAEALRAAVAGARIALDRGVDADLRRRCDELRHALEDVQRHVDRWNVRLTARARGGAVRPGRAAARDVGVRAA